MDVRSNLAHDYSRFEEDEDQVKPHIKQLAKHKVRPKTTSVARAASYMLITIVMLSMLIYCRAMQVELDAKYSSTVKGISKIKDENNHLQIKLESKMSLKNIEDIATNQLFLEKVDDQNIEYLNLNIKDKVEVIKKKSVWSNVSGWLSGIFD